MFYVNSTMLVLLFYSFPLFSLTIEEVPALVRRQNKASLAAEQDVLAAQHAESAAQASYFPKIELKSSFTRLDRDVVIDIPKKRFEKQFGELAIGIDIDPPPVKVQKRDIFNSHLLLTQPIYTGGRIAASVEAANAQLSEANLISKNQYDDVLVETLERYFSVKLSHSLVEALNTLRDDLDRLEQISNSLVKTGMLAKFSTLQIKVAKAELQAKLIEAEAKSKLALLALKSSLGMSGTATFSLDSELKRLPLTEGLDVFKVLALQRRREFPLIVAKERQIKALFSATTGDMLPTVYAFGKRELLVKELTLLQPQWAIGVGIDIPLTAGLAKIPQRLHAAELKQKLVYLKEKAEVDIPLQVESQYTSCQAASAGLDALEEGFLQAKEGLRLAEVRFKSGAGSAMESLKSAADFEAIQVKKLLLLEEYNRNLIVLFQVSGEVEDYLSLYKSRVSQVIRKE